MAKTEGLFTIAKEMAQEVEYKYNMKYNDDYLNVNNIIGLEFIKLEKGNPTYKLYYKGGFVAKCFYTEAGVRKVGFRRTKWNEKHNKLYHKFNYSQILHLSKECESLNCGIDYDNHDLETFNQLEQIRKYYKVEYININNFDALFLETCAIEKRKEQLKNTNNIDDEDIGHQRENKPNEKVIHIQKHKKNTLKLDASETNSNNNTITIRKHKKNELKTDIFKINNNDGAIIKGRNKKKIIKTINKRLDIHEIDKLDEDMELAYILKKDSLCSKFVKFASTIQKYCREDYFDRYKLSDLDCNNIKGVSFCLGYDGSNIYELYYNNGSCVMLKETEKNISHKVQTKEYTFETIDMPVLDENKVYYKLEYTDMMHMALNYDPLIAEVGKIKISDTLNYFRGIAGIKQNYSDLTQVKDETTFKNLLNRINNNDSIKKGYNSRKKLTLLNNSIQDDEFNNNINNNKNNKKFKSDPVGRIQVYSRSSMNKS